jgi:hypothetical protein
MKKCIITFLLLVVLMPSIYAQSTANYTFSSVSNGSLTDMTTGTTDLLATGAYRDDEASSVTNIGFTFYFMGTAYTQFSINSNGQIRLGSTAISGGAVVPQANVPYLAPIGGNNAIMSSGKVHYKVTGTTPNQILVVEWVDLRIPNPNNTGTYCTLQALLNEGSSKIDYAYGSMFNNGTGETRTIFLSSSNTASGTVGSVTIGATPTFTTNSATPVSNSLADNSAIANLNSTSNGTRWIYTFTPLSTTPVSPITITGTNITNNSLRLSWTDNSTTETYFEVFQSEDGLSYSKIGNVVSTTTGATGTAYSINVTGLASQHTYYFRVTANNEGSAASPYLQGNFTTTAIVSAGSGNWGDAATWSSGTVPVATDTVTIANGHTVTINVAAVCQMLTVGQGTSGILQFEQTTARTLTVGGNITVYANGTFQSNPAGTQKGHIVSLSGNLVNNGTLDFSTNVATAGANITFTGTVDASFSGPGVTDLMTITINKGTSYTPLLDFNLTNPFTVQDTSSAPGFLILQNGTFKLSGGYTQTNRVFTTANYNVPATAGFWLNSSPFTILAYGGSNPTVNGLLRVTVGNYQIGNSGSGFMGFGTGAVFSMEGGLITARGGLNTSNQVTVNISGGQINVASGSNTTANASFGFNNSANILNFTGGTIILYQANSNATPANRIDYDVKGSTLNFTGTTLQVGLGSTTGIFDFRAKGEFPNTTTNNSTNNKNLIIVGTDFYSTFRGSLTTVASTSLDLNGIGVNFNGNVINNGTINGTTSGSRMRFSGSSAQTLSGGGTVTSLLYSLEMNNSNGLTITHTNQVFCQNVVFYSGSITNGNKITLGNGSSAVSVQFGDPTTPTTGAGNFSAAPTFNIGTGSYKIKYYKETTARTTGFEIPLTRIIDSLELNNNSTTLTVAGGSGITINKELTLTTGRIITTATNIIILSTTVTTIPTGSATSFVAGPLSIQLNTGTNTSRTFAIGDGTKWRPVVISNFHSNSVLVTYTAESIYGNSGGTPSGLLLGLNRTRYFRIQGTISSTSTPTVQISYGSDDDLVGNVPTARVAQSATSNGTYASIGGTTASSPTTGIVSTSYGTGEYFVLGNEQRYRIVWGGVSGNWSDASKWLPNAVPIPVDDIELTSSGSATITVDVSPTVNQLFVTAGTLTLTLSSNTITVNDVYTQSGGTLSVNGGIFDFKKDFTITSGTYTATSGISKFSATANSQNINGATFYDLLLTGGSGANWTKNLIGGNSYTVSNDFTVQTSAILSLSTATATTFNLAGNLVYGGAAGGTNLSSLTLNLTGTGKTINGSATANVSLEKSKEVGTDNINTATTTIVFNITIATGGYYTASDLLTINSTLTINGRLDVGSVQPNVQGSGIFNLSDNGILGNTSNLSDGGRTLINMATQNYANGSIINYCGNLSTQYIPANHPSSSMIYTSGSGTKTLIGDLSLSGNSLSATGKYVIEVGAGTTLNDAGYNFTLTGTYANLNILGTYSSTGTGKIQWSSGSASSFITANNTFGDIVLNDRDVSLNSNGASSNVTFRSFTTGGTTGGTLYLDATGNTPLTVTGNVSISPATVSNSGGGFNGTTGKNGYVLVQGNYTSTSTNAAQYIIGNTGTNVIEFSNTSVQSITCGASATIIPANATLRANNTVGFQVNSASTFLGALELKNGSAISGSGSIIYSGLSSKLMFTGTTSSTTTNVELPNAPNGPAQFTVDKTNTGDVVTLHASRSFNGNITLTKGILAIGGASGDEHTLTINSGFVYTPGNATLVGGTFSNLTFAVESAGAATLPGVTLKNLEVNRTAGVTMAGDVTINGTTTFANGHLNTSSYQVNYTTSASNPAEGNGTSINGKAVMQSRSITTTELNFLGVHLISGADVGSVTITRNTGTHIVMGTAQGINCWWDVVVTTQPSVAKSVEYSWYSEYDNGKTFSAANYGGVWRSTDAGTSFSLIGTEIDVSASGLRTIPISTTQFSQWTTTDHNSPLAVELASFTSSIIDRDVKLDWRTTEEVNNSGFDIERATYNPKTPENQAWSKIGFVEAKQNPIGSNYSYNDRKLNTGKYLYRLKQIDYNGNYTYYPLKNEVVIGIPKKYDLSQNYPNPFNPVTKIDYNLPYDSKVSIKIYDMVGREVMTLLNEQKPAGFYTLEFNAINLSSGAYFYRIIADHDNDKFIATKKMMLVK